MVFVLGLGLFNQAEASNLSNEPRNIETFKINVENFKIDSDDSVKCWVFKQWVKSKLKEVSNDTELINATADSLKELCEIANDLGVI